MNENFKPNEQLKQKIKSKQIPLHHFEENKIVPAWLLQNILDNKFEVSLSHLNMFNKYVDNYPDSRGWDWDVLKREILK
jgi:hypothetical protein